MPVSVICIVVLTRSARLDAKASITIRSFGLIFSDTLLIISEVSIPVIPKTPGDIAHTEERFFDASRLSSESR